MKQLPYLFLLLVSISITACSQNKYSTYNGKTWEQIAGNGRILKLHPPVATFTKIELENFNAVVFVETGAALSGLTLSWYLAEPPEVPAQSLLLMAAETAHAMSRAEQVHQHWVDSHKETIRKAALQGKQSVTLYDGLPAVDAAWPKRCAILQGAGFNTQLMAVDQGVALVIGW